MAAEVEIVIPTDADSPSLDNKDGQLRSTRSKQGEASSSQQPVPSSEDASLLPSARIAEWLRSIETNEPEETEKSTQLQRPKIPKVPKTFREIGEAYYVPSVVSIGPYHHGNPQLAAMEKLKVTMAKEFATDSGKSTGDLYKMVAEVAEDVRNYYIEDKIQQFDDEDLTQMMFHGCFILQFINCFLYKSDNLKMTRRDAALVVRDLFLLENQLPFPVLKSLMNDLRFKQDKEGMEMMKDFIEKIRALPPQRDTVRKRIEKFVDTQRGSCKKIMKLYNIIWRGAQTSETSLQDEVYSSAVHLLQLLHIQFIEEPVDRSQMGNEWYWYHPATELKGVGIHFEPSRTNQFWDVMKFKPTFFGGTLKLPPVTIDDSTKSKFLNLVAYESCCSASDRDGVTSYVCFMDSLIDSAEDVRELRSKGIILNFLGSDQDVADLFNGIANSLRPNPFAYAKVKKDIESHYKNSWKLLRVDCWNYFFSNRWYLFAYAQVQALIYSIH